MRPQQRAATSRRQSQAASAGKMPAARSWKVLDLESLQAQSTRGSLGQPSGRQRNSAPGREKLLLQLGVVEFLPVIQIVEINRIFARIRVVGKCVGSQD